MIADALYRLARPALRIVDPEVAHRLAVRGLAAGLGGSDPEPDDARLACRLGGLDLTNPIGLAAGFDKDAEVPDALRRLGFGLVEVGTITPRPQPGNPRPRLFRLDADEAVINRYGLNSGGLDAAVARLSRRPRGGGGLGVNVGKNKDQPDDVADFVEGVERTAALADYQVVNVSSPNTPGLRALQDGAAMRRIVEAATAARDRAVPTGPAPPLFVKLAPDLDDEGLRVAAGVAIETGLDGLIMGNTTVSRPPGLASTARAEVGGLSGRPLAPLATERLATLYRMTEGRLPLVGCGGIATGRDAYERIRAGASAVQLYSALVYAGPGLVRRLKRDLAACLARDGFRSVAEAVGSAHR